MLPDLFKAAEGSSDPAVKEAAAVLAQWDRATDINSRGAVLFRIFADQYFGTNGDIDERLRVKFDPAYPV